MNMKEVMLVYDNCVTTSVICSIMVFFTVIFMTFNFITCVFVMTTWHY